MDKYKSFHFLNKDSKTIPYEPPKEIMTEKPHENEKFWLKKRSKKVGFL